MLFFLTRKVLISQFRSSSKGSSPLNNSARKDFTFPQPEFRMLVCCLLLGRETSKKRAIPGDAGAQPPALPFLRLLKFRPSPRTFPKLPPPLPRVRVQGSNLLGVGEIVQKVFQGPESKASLAVEGMRHCPCKGRSPDLFRSPRFSTLLSSTPILF